MKKILNGKIREIKKEDLMRCQDIIYACCYKACQNQKHMIELRKHYSLINLEKFFKNSKIFFVFEKDKKVLASGRITNKNEIRTIYVEPDYQRKGIGTRLIKKLEDFAKNKKIKKLHLHAMATAIHFYEKLGYMPIKNFRKKDNKMEKRLE